VVTRVPHNENTIELRRIEESGGVWREKRKTIPASGSLAHFSDFFYHNFQCDKYGEQILIELIQKM